MTFSQAVTSVTRNAFQFQGRASRAEFWWVAPLPVALVFGTITLVDIWNFLSHEIFLFPILNGLLPAMVFCLIAAGTRRLIDAGFRFYKVFKYVLLAAWAAYTGLGTWLIILTYFFNYSTEALLGYGIILMFICLPLMGLLFLAFAIPLALPTKPNPSEATP